METAHPPQQTTASPRLLDPVRGVPRRKHCCIRTEQCFIDWIRRFVLFHGKRHPAQMGKPEVIAFMTHLAVQRDVAASTQNQTLSAIPFLYRDVLELDLGWIGSFERPKRPARLPVVLTPIEARAILAQLEGAKRLMPNLLYGSGLRLMERLLLRVKEVDFGYREIRKCAAAHLVYTHVLNQVGRGVRSPLDAGSLDLPPRAGQPRAAYCVAPRELAPALVWGAGLVLGRARANAQGCRPV